MHVASSIGHVVAGCFSRFSRSQGEPQIQSEDEAGLSGRLPSENARNRDGGVGGWRGRCVREPDWRRAVLARGATLQACTQRILCLTPFPPRK